MSSDSDVKMYIVVNDDLKMGKGKIAGQVGHVVAQLIRKLEKSKTKSYKQWMSNNEPKIILKSSEKELISLRDDRLTVEIHDMGLTQIAEDSLTVIGFIPLYSHEVPSSLKTMKLL